MTVDEGRSRMTHRDINPYVNFKRRQKFRPYLKFPAPRAASKFRHGPRTDDAAPWQVPLLCDAYNWPSNLPGGGVIALVELGGGWSLDDLTRYFNDLDQPLPSVTDISLDGVTGNNFGRDENSDTEVALDIQVAAASYFAATGQAATIRIYWIADNIAEAVRQAAADGCDVCSISWGSDEALWGTAAGTDMEEAAAAATASGMIVLAASGDNDSSDGGPNPANVDLPNSCPHVIGCGGTRKTPTSETVWNNDPGSTSGEGTGGGYSTLFKPMPDWQIGAPNGPGRMVPDVAANADPETGYTIVVKGAYKVVGGTSAVAPLYAGLFASFGAKLGFITPTLYQNQVCFNDITSGDNGAYRAGIGPDPCTGLGSPIGTRLANLLAQPATSPPASTSKTRSASKGILQPA